MSIGFWQIAIVVVLVVLLFGRGKISGLMGDVAKGIKSFKKGLSDESVAKAEMAYNLYHEAIPKILATPISLPQRQMILRQVQKLEVGFWLVLFLHLAPYQLFVIAILPP